jgi:integrase
MEKLNEIQVFRSQDLTISQENCKETPKYWEKEFINIRMDKIQNIKHRMLFFFLWRSALRITEALSITKADIDFQNDIIRARWLKKRKKQIRLVPMHPDLKNVLQVYVAPFKADEKLFGISRQRAWQMSMKYFDGHPHQFRHSFAVNWLRCGGDLFILSRFLGHSDIRITMVYLQIVPIDQGKELLKVTF